MDWSLGGLGGLVMAASLAGPTLVWLNGGPSVSASVHSPIHIDHQSFNPPQEEDPIVIDRFDGRALLDDRALFMKKKSRKRYVCMWYVCGRVCAYVFRAVLTPSISSRGSFFVPTHLFICVCLPQAVRAADGGRGGGGGARVRRGAVSGPGGGHARGRRGGGYALLSWLSSLLSFVISRCWLYDYLACACVVWCGGLGLYPRRCPMDGSIDRSMDGLIRPPTRTFT